MNACLKLTNLVVTKRRTFYETIFKNRDQFDSYIIESKENSLSEYYDNLPKLLEKFNRSPNFQKKIDEIKIQFESQNFAEVTFEEPLIKHYVTIVAPKFE